jgi:hypothetical protein
VRYADKPAAEVSTWIDAPLATVWSLVANIELMTTLSAELRAVQWLEPATGPAIGATFRGDNQRGASRWSTVSHVIEYQPGAVFAWAVGDAGNPGTTWKFTLGPEDGGTRLNQSLQMGPGSSGVSMAIESWPDRESSIIASRLCELSDGMARNLAAIKDLAEQS